MRFVTRGWGEGDKKKMRKGGFNDNFPCFTSWFLHVGGGGGGDKKKNEKGRFQ